MAQVIQLPGASVSPVIQGRPRGRRPGNVVSLQAFGCERQVRQHIAAQRIDQLLEKLGYHRAWVEQIQAEIQRELGKHGVR